MSVAKLRDEQDDAKQARRHQAQANQGLIELLNSWANPTDEERQEQAETWEYLKRAIDEDRPDGAKLYA
jgi:hypothetical protein